MKGENTTNWKLLVDGIDDKTVALYENSYGGLIEISDSFKDIKRAELTGDQYRVSYSPNIDDNVLKRRMCELADEDFDDLEIAFHYAVRVLAGEELDKEMVPEEYYDEVLE